MTCQLRNPLQPSFTQLLIEMDESHRALLVCMDEMEEITESRSFRDTGYSSARLRISQASFKRRMQLQRVCQKLKSLASEADSHTLKSLLDADARLQGQSSEHVSRWSATEVEKDWEGYRAASKEIRQHMMAHLQAERAELFPVLQKMARAVLNPFPTSENS